MAKEKYYHVWMEATDRNGERHFVTVVGRLTQKTVRECRVMETRVRGRKPKSLRDGVITYDEKMLSRKLTIGLSISHPTDEFNEEEGVRVAKRRIKNGDILGELETSYATMLTEDAILGELMVKLMYITKNIDKYINRLVYEHVSERHT